MSHAKDLEVRVLKRMHLYRDALMQIERVASRFKKDVAGVPESAKRSRRGKGWAFEDGLALGASVLGDLAASALDEGEK